MNERMFRKISLKTAAAVLDKGVTFIRWGLQDGALPIGVAVACRDGRGRKLRRFMYRIDAQKLSEYSGWPVDKILKLNREIKMKQHEAYEARRRAECEN